MGGGRLDPNHDRQSSVWRPAPPFFNGVMGFPKCEGVLSKCYPNHDRQLPVWACPPPPPFWGGAHLVPPNVRDCCQDV